jgi:GDP-L-fucose synthase
MPTNLYGINDNFDPVTAHVLPALIRRFHEAKQRRDPIVTVWGTGTPRREFLYVDDLAEACCFLMDHYDDSDIVNIGTGSDITIAELAQLLAAVTGYQGDIVFDPTKPDGTPVKRLDVSKINQLGWQAKTSLADGLAATYRWFCESKK